MTVSLTLRVLHLAIINEFEKKINYFSKFGLLFDALGRLVSGFDALVSCLTRRIRDLRVYADSLDGFIISATHQLHISFISALFQLRT